MTEQDLKDARLLYRTMLATYVDEPTKDNWSALKAATRLLESVNGVLGIE